MITCRTAGDSIVMTVEDEGPGIIETDQDAVFDAFFRAESDRVQKPDGSGLGLSVVSAIGRAHGGKAHCVKSRLGGTCIQITIPGYIKGK